MDTFGSPKRPYVFRGIVPMKLLPEESIVEAQLLVDKRKRGETLDVRLLQPLAFLEDAIEKKHLNTDQLEN